MTELGRDARALVARVKRRDGPTEADRARLRSRLEPVWAAQRMDAIAAVPEVVPHMTHGWMSWVSGLLLLSLGFLAPEAPRTLAREAPLAQAQPVPGSAALAVGPPAAQSGGAREQQVVRQLSAASTVEQRPPGLGRAAERRTRQRPVRRAPPPPAANAAVAANLPASPRATATATATAPETASAVRARISEEPARPSAAAATESVAARSGELAPDLHSRAFAPQPIDDELTWLSAAQEALRNDQPSAALRLVQEHAFRFPQGALASERVAVHALALCALSRKAAARAVVSDLELRAPNSPLLARVRRNCGF